MAILTIKEIVEPADETGGLYGGLFVVHVEEHNTPIYMYKDQLDLMKFEHLMQVAGVTDEVIENHRYLIERHIQNERARDGECA